MDEIIATVTLPNCVDSSVRLITSQDAWQTEKAAAKDAAFQCYTALYSADLLNENLLPLSHDLNLQLDEYEKFEPRIEVSPQFNPWLEVAKAWKLNYAYDVVVTFEFHDQDTHESIKMVLTMPLIPPTVQPLRAYWDFNTVVNISFHYQPKR